MSQIFSAPNAIYQYLEFDTLPVMSVEGIVPPIAVSNVLAVVSGNLVSTVNGTEALLPISDIIPPTTNTLVYDALAKTITSTVNGVAQTISTATLDDEGVTLVMNGGNLELRNSSGTLLSTSPIPDRDNQTLTLTGNTIAISSGNSITLPATTVSNAFNALTRTLVTTVNGVAAAAVTIPDAQTLTLTGNSLSISGGNAVTLPTTTVSNTVTGAGLTRTISTTVNGVVGAAVAIPDNDIQTLTLTGSTIAISSGNSITLPASTVSNTVTGTGAARTLTTTVNGVAATAVAIPDTEAQTLTLTGNSLAISGGNNVTLPASTVSNTVTGTGATRTLSTTVNGVVGTAVALPDTEAQTLTLTGSVIAISGGNSITLPTPTTTVSNTVTGTGATRTLTTTVNGVAATAVTLPDTEAQTLTLTGTTLAISGGNSITLPAAGATTVSNTVTGTGTARTLSTTVNGVVGTAVAIPDTDAQTLTLTGTTLAISAGNSVTLPAGITSNTLAITKAAGAVSTINTTVIGTQAIPTGTVADVLGFNAAGALVFSTVVKPKRIKETYITTAVSLTTAAPILTAGVLEDVYAIDTLIEVTATGATITLTSPSAAISAEMIGVEIDVKLSGSWAGSTTISAAGTIDGAATLVINKTTTTQPSRSLRWTGTKWLIV